MNDFIKNQNWRYSTKKFDSNKKISKQDFETLKIAIQLSTSSYGLQPYKILVIENEEIRKQLQPLSWGQTQIVDASHLLVFASYTFIDNLFIDKYIEQIALTRSLDKNNLAGYGDFMKSKITTLAENDLKVWTAKQTYLALGNLINAAAEIKIDVTPMEGFEPEKYNEILGLSSKNLTATLVATIGYRSEEDTTQYLAKVRKPISELFEII